MKSLNPILIFIFILFIVAGCGESKKPADDYISVDVTASYPEKKLILQDFMNVEYIPLETTDEFICKGHIQAVGKKFIIATNRNGDGNIYIFDRKGKALRIINRKGEGGEEYLHATNAILEEDSREIFVNDKYGKKIVVYDLKGNFKRKFPHKKDLMYNEVYNFDMDNLICHDAINDHTTLTFNAGQSFMLVSKQDGSVTKEIEIPFKEKKSIVIRTPKDKVTGRYTAFMPPNIHSIIPYFNDYILVELSADTVYRYSSDQTMKPFIVRTPSIQSMDPEVYLFLSMFTDRYYFMETFIKGGGHQADLMYDKQVNSLFTYKVYNGDYTNDKEAFLKSDPINYEIPSRQYLEAGELVEDYEKGVLKGKLKEIAAKLDPEDNPVIMLIKHKKK